MRKDLDRPNVTVKVQEDFVAWGTDTLQKLDEYIRQCDAVIHLVGERTGAMAGPSAPSTILGRYPDFIESLAPISDTFTSDGKSLSYAQWEAYLAVYHGKPLIIAVPSSDVSGRLKEPASSDESQAQKAHLARLESLGRYPEIVFHNSDRLAVEILRSHLHNILHQSPEEPFSAVDSEVRTFLASITVPYQLIESQKLFSLYRIIDPTSLFSNEFILAVAENALDHGFIDTVVAIARGSSASANIMLVYVKPLTREVARYVEARGVVAKSLAEFRDDFAKLGARERYYVGALAAENLCETLNIDRCYVEPDAAPVIPGDHMENSFLKTRARATELVANFIEGDERIMFIFGGYGSGKSAFCAHILKSPDKLPVCTPIYYPLRQLESPDDLSRVVAKCRQLGGLYGGVKRISVVILDGLDELPNAMHPDEKRKNMLRILEGAARAEKIIITARASYFRGLDDFWRLFSQRGDSSLWRDIARLMPTGGGFPKVSAIALREFDTDQVMAFAEKFAARLGGSTSLPSEFSLQLSNDGTGPNYMMLARNPLYLYLLLGSRPWANANVKCVADVYGIFIRYWLERDIEKGKSRWGFTTDDRFEFMYYVAFAMFLNRRHALRFGEFDEMVRKFFHYRLKESELSALALDLQTTGAFGSIGNHIHFAVPAFSDYLIARRFMLGDFAIGEESGTPPDRMPTIDQTIMWTGMAETEQKGISYHEILLSKNSISISEKLKQGMILDPKLALYERYKNEYLQWDYLNTGADEATGVRMIANAVVLNAAASSSSTVLVKLLNKRGLHARASAKLVAAYEVWLEELAARWEKPVLWISREGPGEEKVVLRSIMGLMMLSAGLGTMLVINFENCSLAEVETLLERLGCIRPAAFQNYWGITFGEAD